MILINIIGGVCLLLWGLRGVRMGMTRAFGAGLHTVIAHSTKNRLTAFMAGIGVTALLQSSTATALIIASFCGRGVMTLSGGLAVMLGADVGTTLVAQVLTFDLSWLAPALMIIGYALYSIYKRAGRMEHVGKLLIGLGLMLLALSWIKTSAAPMRDSEVLKVVLQSLVNDPILAILITAVLTWMAHSSLAVVLLLLSLVTSGVLSAEVGIVMVIGANIGGAIAPLLATLKDSPEACRVPYGNLIMRMVIAITVLPFIDNIHEALLVFGESSERLIVNFHTAFNLVVALVFLPLTSTVALACQKMIPDRPASSDKGRAKYLDEKELGTPTIALSYAMRETLRLADIVHSMLSDTIKALDENDKNLVKDIEARDDIIDSVYKAIKMYMAKITQESLDPEEAQQYVQILSLSTNLESAGDTIDKSLMDMTRKKISGRVSFSKEGWKEIQDIHSHVMNTMRLSQSVFVSGDRSLARAIVESKETLRQREQEATQSHLLRIREGVPETIATSSLHLDIIRDFRRINSYVATVAYPILEEAGDLHKTRLRPLKRKSSSDEQ